MRVLIVHNSYGKRSGEEVVVENQHDILTRRGHEVHRFERSSAGLRETRTGQIAAFFSAFGNRETVSAFKDMLLRCQPDIVHIHNLYPWISPAILPVCRGMRVPVVMSVHNYRLLCPNGLMFTHGAVCERCSSAGEHWCVIRNCEGSLPKSLGYALRNYVARRRRWYADAVNRYAVLTEFQKNKLVGAGYPAERMVLLPNATNIPKFVANGSKADALGFIGRVSTEKGVSVLIKAMRVLAMPCRIAGSFDAQPELREQAPSNVEFLGMLDKRQLAELYTRLRFVVAPSNCYEGFPMAIVEAMAQGKPVIASRIGGIPEIVDDGVTGLLFEPGNADELSQKIRYLWERPELCRQMGEAGRAKVAREYSEERYYQRLMAIYQDAIESKHAG